MGKSLSLCGKPGLLILSKILSNVLKMGRNRAERPGILYFFMACNRAKLGSNPHVTALIWTDLERIFCDVQRNCLPAGSGRFLKKDPKTE